MSDAVNSTELLKVREGFTDFVDKVSDYWCTDDVLTELMTMRKYDTQEMYNTLKDIGVFRCSTISDLTYFIPTDTETLQKWGLITSSGDFLLKGRFVVPIRDITDKVTALVGWYPDNRKYITTPTYGFCRDAQFFNIECYVDCMKSNDGVVYLVEGIFDTISLRSLGFSALGNMGLEMSSLKTQILKRFNKVVAIPDNDKAGRSANPYCRGISNKSKIAPWIIENNNVFVQLPNKVKDVDDFIKEFECYDDLYSCRNAKVFKKLKEDV